MLFTIVKLCGFHIKRWYLIGCVTSASLWNITPQLMILINSKFLLKLPNMTTKLCILSDLVLKLFAIEIWNTRDLFWLLTSR
jgi:hypothetical protein